MFVAPRVLHIWFDALCERGILRSWNGGSVWLFALSGAVWMQTMDADGARNKDDDRLALNRKQNFGMKTQATNALTSMAEYLLG